jgi:hypothetical protein
MVKVDMAAALSGAALQQPVHRDKRLVDNHRNINGLTASGAWRLTLMRIDRRWIRDVGLAVLLALPTAALTRPPPADANRPTAKPYFQLAVSDRTPLQQRFNLPG